jgi:uncharacterized protein (TIGR02145 family)
MKNVIARSKTELATSETKWKQSTISCLVFALVWAIFFVACGDESSSSVSPEPRQCEEQSDDCDNVSSSSEKISKNSSSSQKSADKGKSSSSVEKSKSSSSEGKVASSSSKKDETSSSSVEKAKESSSSVKQSSSSEAKSSSSEEAKQSSSSVVMSSSSEEEESSSSYDRTSVFYGYLWRDGKYIKFTDPRNNREYYYIQIDGKDTAGKAASIKVMAENLDIGEFVWSFDEQEDDSKIEKYCYKNDTSNCDKYGGLYQWAEMMQLPSRCNTESCADLIKPNHQGICPDGWRLLTYNDYYIVVNVDNNPDGVAGTRSGSFGGTNQTGYALVGAGYLWNHAFTDIGKSTYWYYPEEKAGALIVYASAQSTASKVNPKDGVNKTHGFSVRCVMVE